jgi:hypothetical protein
VLGARNRIRTATLLTLFVVLVKAAGAADVVRLKVADPYIELHTGPGRGYPITRVVERGEAVDLLKRRTDWFLVRDSGGHEGWVYRDQLSRTLTPEGERASVEDATEAQYRERAFEFGAMGGELEGANTITVYGAWQFTENLALQLGVTQALGEYSDNLLADVDVVHQPFPDWRVSPFFALGTGMIRTDPAATLVSTEDRTDQTAHVAVGARMYLARRFVLRAEYRNYLVFTSRNDNEELDSWQAGFAFFF